MGKKHKIKSSLVVFQFAVSIILFICTVVIYNQLKFIQNKNLGFDKENIVIINKADNMGNQIESFRKELLSNPKIINISNSAAIPVATNGGHVYKLEGSPDSDIQVLSRIFCDYEFVDTYKIKMKKGRFFSRDHPSDTLSVIINEAALKLLNLKNPLGKRLIRLGTGLQQKFNIIGVTENFNYESLHESIHPLIIHLFNSNQHGQYISARIAPGDYQAVISFLNNKWEKYSAGQPFEYNFFDQNLASLYKPEQSTSKIAATFSILAIFIACLGLLGLVIFSTGQRTKEIGIRKVVGASLTEIVILLSKELIRCVVLANIIAWPIAYYIMNNWLKNFAYRTNLNWTMFVLAGLAALIMALATVSFQTIKAAKANPVKSLRYE
jgi:putative ABC transport system permease protein